MEKYTQKKFPGWNADWLWTGFTAVPDAMDQHLKCDKWEDLPSLIVERDTFANFYHDSEDFFTVFFAIALLGLSRDNVQILITDLYPWGPFKPMWTEVFGHKPALSAWDIKEKYGKSRVCFKNLIVGIYGPASPLAIKDFPTGCKGSPLVRAYSDYVIRGLGLQKYTHMALSTKNNVIVMTWMSRRPSVMWPERGYCDDRFFICSEWQHLSKRVIGRIASNDAEVTKMLQGFETGTSELIGVSDRSVVFEAVDYNLVPFQDQIRQDIQTDILIGPHGAGLSHTLFLPDRAHLVEVFIQGSSANKHFQNFARWRGVGYTPVSGSGASAVNILKLKEVVIQAIKSIDISQPKF
eukprot:CAMPEP_0184306484 /NCGR_PEP_ID=MMETSP1049-20130417/15474_1 /TAXON_ID=77928 /ORGANISM="Proteomonas sulcata, Strain CCMP704" /LENGTH=350 /DNA_ID=CAMNT_0026618761 /DNA_START=34 /DNA_END=1086 /DNA_ORIENTATION=+